MDFFGNNKKLHFRPRVANHRQVQTCTWLLQSRSSLEETASLKYPDLSLAELGRSPIGSSVSGKEECFLFPAEVVIQSHFLSEMQGTSLPMGSVMCAE